MDCRRLTPNCYNCGAPVVPHSVWITVRKSLRVEGLCLNCEEKNYVEWRLTDLLKSCPEEVKELEAAIDKQIEEICEGYDSKFLHAMGICEDE